MTEQHWFHQGTINSYVRSKEAYLYPGLRLRGTDKQNIRKTKEPLFQLFLYCKSNFKER